jgi:hypothetical protein
MVGLNIPYYIIVGALPVRKTKRTVFGESVLTAELAELAETFSRRISACSACSAVNVAVLIQRVHGISSRPRMPGPPRTPTITEP